MADSSDWDPVPFAGARDERGTRPAGLRVGPPGSPPAPPGNGDMLPGGARDPVAFRKRLLKAHLRSAHAAYRKALAGGARDPVVLIADVNDGRTACLPSTLLDQLAGPPPAVLRSGDGAAVLVLPAERALARAAVRALAPAAVDALDAHRTDSYLVIVAGAGGLTFSLAVVPVRGDH